MAEGTFREEPARGNGSADGDSHYYHGGGCWCAERGRMPPDLFPARFDSRVLWRGHGSVRHLGAVFRATNGKGLSRGGVPRTLLSSDPGRHLSPGDVTRVVARVLTRKKVSRPRLRTAATT